MQTLDVHRPGMPDLQFVLLVTVLCTSRLTIAHTFVYAANQFGTSFDDGLYERWSTHAASLLDFRGRTLP